MLLISASVLGLLVSSPMLADADVGAEPALPWQVDAAVATGTPAVLPGLAIGAMAEVARRRGGSPLFVSLRGQWTSSSAANEAWIIDHDQFVLAGGVGIAGTLGVGRVWAQAGAGATGLREVLSRHQLDRIQMSGVPGGTDTSFALGPYGFAELGIAVRMRGDVSAFVAGGASTARLGAAGETTFRFGAGGRIGVLLEF